MCLEVHKFGGEMTCGSAGCVSCDVSLSGGPDRRIVDLQGCSFIPHMPTPRRGGHSENRQTPRVSRQPFVYLSVSEEAIASLLVKQL